MPREMLRVCATLRLLAMGALCTGMLRAQSLELRGRVTDENGAPAAHARITIHSANLADTDRWRAETNPAGNFAVTVPSPGDYLADVQREGFYELKNRAVHIDKSTEITLVINRVQEVFQSVNVDEQPSPVDITQTRSEEHLTGTEINDIPYPNSHSLRDAMKVMPGVLEDAGGGLHLNGSSESQVQYLLNGLNITDPVSGQYRTTLAVEGIRSVDSSSGRYSPEMGKGTAGVLAFHTDTGTDKFHYTATDFVPGLQLQQGIRFGNWYPRVGISGPIVRGHAWFADNFESEYTTALVTGLPAGQNTRGGWAGSNLFHLQLNPTERNILYADFLVNLSYQNRVGLDPLDPVSTTQTVHSREYFGSLKDQIFVGRYVLEVGYAHNEFNNSQTPQGPGIYIFSPSGRSGNYFVSGSYTSSRDEGTVHVYAPAFSLFGSHQIEAGVDADRLAYDGNFHRTGYELLGVGNQLLSQTSFTGSGLFGVRDTEMAAWILDTWRISRRLQVTVGLREDWDRLVDARGWSPRVAFSWAPFHSARTRVAGGYSVTHDAVALEPFGRALDQSALTSEFNSDGTPSGPPELSQFGLGPGLKLPRAGNWSLSVDHEIDAHLFAKVSYLRRRGTDGFNFVNVLAPDSPPSLLPLPAAAAPGVYDLSNLRRDDFDSLELSVHQTLSGQHEWMMSFTHSRAQSNAVLDYNVATPLQVLPVLVPMPWDSPNRLLGWAYLPLPRKNWSAAVLADARSGFPFSVQDQAGVISGGVDSHRYPWHFDLNLDLERVVTLRGYRFGLMGGVNNVTNHKNATAVNNVVGSSQYLQFLGDEGRHFVVRIRFFGHGLTK